MEAYRNISLKRGIAIAIMLSFILAPVSMKAQHSPWPMFRHDLKHTARTTYTGPASPTLAWTFSAKDALPSSPSIGNNGTIYFGAGWQFGPKTDSAIYAINPDSTLKWQYITGGPVFSSPAIGPTGIIYIASTDQYLYALEDSVTYGKLLWKTKLGIPFVIGSPTVGPDNNVYIGSASFDFYALDAFDGTIRWNFKAKWCIISSPAITDNGTIYIGSKDEHLYAFSDDLRDSLWAFKTGKFYDGHLVDCSPAVGADGTIYVGSDQFGAAGHTPVPVDTSFWAINPDGTLKWAFNVGNGVESSPAIGQDGSIYFGSYDSCLYALADSGNIGILKWKFRTHGAVDGSPTIDDEGIIYFGSRDSTIYALYPQDGSVKWSYKTGGGIESSPTIDNNGYLYIGSFDGKLYCLGTGAPDVGVASIDLPNEFQAGATYALSAKLRNLRAGPRAFAASCIIDTAGLAVYTDTITLTDFPGDTVLSKFFVPWKAGPNVGVAYHISVKTILSSDDHPYNDTSSEYVNSVERSYLCGDANGNGVVNALDITFLINYLYKHGPAPNPLEAGDANGSGVINVLDVTYLINFLYKHGPAPNCP